MPQIIPNLHPLAVHFPIALLTLAAVFHIAALWSRNRICAVIAHTSLWLSALGALVAVSLGWLAYNSVSHDEAGHAAMLVHRSWALATFAVTAVLAGWDAWHNKVEDIPAAWFTAATIGAWLLVAITAWHGGELVYRHGLGVMALPAIEEGHHHAHGGEAEHSHEGPDMPADHDHAH